MVNRQWRRGQTIGRGSTATVSLAAASPSGHIFAVKSAELSLSAHLQREQAILSALHHPNIVSCLGFDVTAEAPFATLSYNLFLEYAPLGSLSDCMMKHGGRLEEAAIRSYTGGMLRGLAYLHANSFAHCDVKSQNVLIWPDGRAKIADLGCARSTAGDGDAGRPIAGTPMFMAPEVARGEEQGAPADVWALGCTVIEMATGRPPWPDAVDPVAALHRVGFTCDLPKRPTWLSDEAKDFLDKCLRRDARERWTAEQLLEHPFVAKPSTTSCSTETALNQVWISPKSTLEQVLWDSVADEEEKDEETGAVERIQQLATSGSPAANWAQDDDWITVRISEEESAAAVPVDGDEDNVGSGVDLHHSDEVNVVGMAEERELCTPIRYADNEIVVNLTEQCLLSSSLFEVAAMFYQSQLCCFATLHLV
ncbi:hypothetical protein OPV22_014501 [Ensete ventricosum]|uniref:Protein kinase domain-containing protein n=1 Tax=Ensete ventricosum TaxID=4639 RepID=A0AAV8R1R3_ENSVE|nr:hypothetical protein OPV22_014501 [Ensete ventricosum]